MAKKRSIPGERPLPQENEPLDTKNDSALESRNESDITAEEKELLDRTAYSMAGPEDQTWEESKLDDKDGDGEPLNEKVEFSGKDLDLPGEEEEDLDQPGNEDEENDTYSLGGDRHDD